MPPRTARSQAGRADRRRIANPRHDVVAVLVAHDGERWLPEALSALKGQLRPPQLTIAVDTGSIDASGRLLGEALGRDSVVLTTRETGFGAAAAAGLAAADRVAADRTGVNRTGGGTAAPGDGRVAWVWLLHDDCAPDPDALDQLLTLAEDMPSAAVFGVKARDWDNPRLLVEVGLTTDAAGHRSTGLERREFDQGQHDAVRDVLAVGTAGALIRRDVWDALGGFDPALPLFRDDIDLGWRAALAGYRVVVAPQARIRHARAAATGQRRLDAVAGRAASVDRRHALYAVMANVSGAALLTAIPRLSIGALLRALAFLLTRQPTAARDELAALAFVLGRPARLRAARRSRRSTRTVPARAVRPLLAGRGARLRGYAEAIADLTAGGRVGPSGGSLVGAGGAVGETGPSAADDDFTPAPAHRLRRLLTRPALLLGVGLSALVVIAARHLLGGGGLYGGALLPAPTGAGSLWSAYTSSWHRVGPGTGAVAPPYLGALAALATVLFGKPWLAVDLLLLGCVPLAGLTAFHASRRLVSGLRLRLWAALTYALLPMVTGAVAGGRLGEAVVIVLLPWLATLAGRLFTADPRSAGWRAVWSTGLVLALGVAFAPVLYPLAAILLVAGGIVSLAGSAAADRAGAVRRAIGAGAAAAVPLLVLAPWSLSVLRHPGVVLVGTGHPEVSLVDPRLHSADLLLLWPGGPGLPVLVTAAGVVVAGLVGLSRTRRRALAFCAWLVVCTGIAGGVLVSRLSAVPPAGPPAVTGWPGIPTAVAAVGVLVAALVAADGARERLARRSFGWRQPAVAVLTGLAMLAPLVAAVQLLTRGLDRPLHRGATSALPAFALAGMGGGGRALFLRPGAGGSVGYDLTRADGNRIGDADVRVPAAQRAHLDRVVGAAVVAQGGEAAAALSSYDVRYVVLPRVGSDALAGVLDAQSGLVRAPFDGRVRLWKVTVPGSHLALLPSSLVSAASSSESPTAAQLAQTPQLALGSRGGVTRIPAGTPDRELVLSEAADARWQASLDGRALPRRTAWGWAQGFAVPASGGVLRVRHADGAHTYALWLQLVALVVVMVLAAPSPRRRSDILAAPERDEASGATVQPRVRPGVPA